MTIQCKCPACGKPVQVDASARGKKIKCPHCQRVLKVPEKVTSAPPPPGASDQPPPVPKPESQPPTAGSEQAFSFIDVSEDRLPTARRSRSKALPIVMGVVVVASFGALAALVVKLGGLGLDANTSIEAPRMKPLGDTRAMAAEKIVRIAELANPDLWRGKVRFELVKGPRAASLNEQTGLFQWQPGESDAGKQHQILIRAVGSGAPKLSSDCSFCITVSKAPRQPHIAPIDDLEVLAGEPLEVRVALREPISPGTLLEYSLKKGPTKARIDGKSGKLSWTPADTDAGKTIRFSVQVAVRGSQSLSSSTDFQVKVVQIHRPIDRLLDELGQGDGNARLLADSFEHSFSGKGFVVQTGGERLRVITYPDEKSAGDEARQIAIHRDRFQMPDLPETWVGPTLYFRDKDLLVIYGGLNPKMLERLSRLFGDSLETASSSSGGGASTKVATPDPPETGPFTADQLQQVQDLYENGQLFKTRGYATLRKMFADRFAREQDPVIIEALGDEESEINQWLMEHEAIKEELYTAIAPKVDDVKTALGLFRDLREKNPIKIVPYANLAIAIAVTWDRPNAVAVYEGPMRQAKAAPPDGLIDAKDSFSYYVDAERLMQGRIRFVPWEFLTHVVNHRTPIVERKWALQNYISKRVMFGACYKDCPYDTGMLNAEDGQGRISGKKYTLPNLRQFGGVCAHQGDFAARVGKSLGVPTAYVTGKSTYGGSHAWVMWVELKGVTAQRIGFTLESYGRYRGDKYYVGNLRDGKSGKRITDRQLELRLHTIGMNVVAKRQSDMIMKLFQLLCKRASLDVVKKFLFLRETIRFCPGNEAAWIALAKMSSDPIVQKKHRKDMVAVMNTMFTTFTRFPDFTWTVFDDLIGFETVPKERLAFYSRLIGLYELQSRPDLACEARLKMADMLAEQDRTVEAINGLALGIKKFPAEGRYVPKMLDKLEAFCGKIDGASQYLVPFYQSFLPMVPQTRGSRPSKYCMDVYERGIDLFKKAGQLPLANGYSMKLKQLRAGGKKTAPKKQ